MAANRRTVPVAMHNDEPVLCDALERVALVREVGDAIATCDPPQVFGLHGDWGLGKTSFLQQVHYYLAGECPEQNEEQVSAAKAADCPGGEYKDQVAVIWFEAWRYQNEAAPVVALLHEIRAQLGWHIKARGKVSKLAEVTIRGALLSMEDLTKKIGFQASKIQEAGEKWEEDHLAAALPSHTLREQLEAAINGLLKQPSRGPQRRVVVLIDDLDRCQPAAAYRLLEGLKIYLTLPNCVFLLGMNQQVVEEAIAKEVPVPASKDNTALRAERAAAYLEKLCQNVWRVPAVRDPKGFLLRMLSDAPIGPWIDRALDNRRCLPPNPRRLKGFANLLQRFQARFLPDLPNADTSDRALALEVKLMLIVAYVYQFHHHLFRFWEASPEVYDHLLDWARGRPIELTHAETEPQKEEERQLLLFQLLQRLGRTESIKDRPTSATLEYTYGSAFPDPANANVFWMQRLLHDVAEAHEVTAAQFVPYLRGRDDKPAQGGP